MTKHHLLKENLESGDLSRLISKKVHIDEYKSKMGTDEDVCVISLTVSGQEPAMDLVNFAEKGYSWVLDADVSSGEQENGEYLVFIEIDRNRKLPEQISEFLDDITKLVEFEREDWLVQYYKSVKKYPATIENIRAMVPVTKEEYLEKFDRNSIDNLKSAAGVDVSTTAPVNEYTDSLRIAAGIK